MATEWTPKTRKLRAASGDGRTRTRITWGCGGLLLGVLLSVIGLVVFAPHPDPVTLSPAAAPADITVTLDDQYLTRLVAQGVKAANLPGFTIGNVKAHIGANNLLTFSGSVQTDPSISLVDLDAQGQISASGGLLVVSNLTGNLGGLTLPGVVDAGLQVGINLAIANERQRLTQGGIHYSIEGVSSTEGRLTVTLGFS